jgi:hypothetical protein
MKPNINFLKKVRDGKVMLIFSYSPRIGGTYKFKGGEATMEKHRAAGFITMRGGASLGRPSMAELTDAGRAALAAEH